MNTDMSGKTVLVTGGSKGIGRAIAAALADAGANLMITSRKPEGLQEAAKEIGNRCQWEAANVGDPKQAKTVIDATIQQFGSLDVLVNNAATNPYAGPSIEVDLARWDKTLQVNLTAPLVWTQLAWQASMKSNGGTVLNISSVAGLHPSQLLGVYGITKAALIHMTKQLAAELAPKVRVNAICPGLIKTDFARALWEGERGEQIANLYPLKRLGEPDDIANSALFLCSQASSWITGHVMIADGGGSINFGNE